MWHVISEQVNYVKCLYCHMDTWWLNQILRTTWTLSCRPHIQEAMSSPGHVVTGRRQEALLDCSLDHDLRTLWTSVSLTYLYRRPTIYARYHGPTWTWFLLLWNSLPLQNFKFEQIWPPFCPFGMCNYNLITNCFNTRIRSILQQLFKNVSKIHSPKSWEFTITFKHIDLLESIKSINILTIQRLPLTHSVNQTCLSSQESLR